MNEHADSADRVAPGRDGLVDITLVTADGCHFCDHAQALLEELRGEYPIRVRTLSLTDDTGAAIARRLRVPYPPVLLVGGKYFGHGRISRRKLARHLAELTSEGRPT